MVENIPYEWKKSVESLDTLLLRTNDILHGKNLDVNDQLSAIKIASDLTEKRLNLFAAPQVMQRAIQYQQKLKQKIEALQRMQPKYEFVQEIEPVSGAPPRITRTLRNTKGKKAVDEQPIV
jgi:hypothetical protein